ncbi:MAG TPA: type 4a pilus biogenesis protein PilO [Gemmatimonadales bacterium]|nr:type 4a pilus biogenesis protein PilO [Gemmatimonadales bacterium]
MALGLPTDRRSQVFLLITMLALAGVYATWTYLVQPVRQEIVAVRAQLDTIDSIVRLAKAELAKGSKDEVERQVRSYGGMLAIMRQLVPEKNEVPTLIDDVSNRSKVRGITIGRIQPLSVEPGAPFDTYKYRLEVYGRYDQVGEFLSDVASLPRIVVPEELVLRPAAQQAQRFLNDTSGALLEAIFTIRTFVKSPTRAPAPAAPGGSRP